MVAQFFTLISDVSTRRSKDRTYRQGGPVVEGREQRNWSAKAAHCLSQDFLLLRTSSTVVSVIVCWGRDAQAQPKSMRARCEVEERRRRRPIGRRSPREMLRMPHNAQFSIVAFLI